MINNRHSILYDYVSDPTLQSAHALIVIKDLISLIWGGNGIFHDKY